jgi:hypothetical protein
VSTFFGKDQLVISDILSKTYDNDKSSMSDCAQREYGCNAVAPSRNQAANKENKSQPTVSGETGLLDSKISYFTLVPGDFII